MTLEQLWNMATDDKDPGHQMWADAHKAGGSYFYAPYIPVGPVAEDLLRRLYEEAGLDFDKHQKIKEAAEAFQRQYYEDHSCCPICQSDSHRSTLLGYVLVIDDKESYKNYRDENCVTCNRCGWCGTTHDLIPRHPKALPSSP